MSEPAIHSHGLSKTYPVPIREPGLAAAAKSLLRRRTCDVEAVRDVSFAIAPGEIVGFLGPNGAGKTTALKMLSGLLNPSAGQVRVLGHEPFRRDKEFLRQITLVMGNRNQLVWDIPVSDSFERNRAIYRLPRAAFRQTVDELTELLDLGDLLGKPVRNLSLGERMKCEIAAALLHRPRILYLDEPTIGLDVTMQRRIVVLGPLLVVGALAHLGWQEGAGALGRFAVTLAAGAAIMYSFWLILSTLAFWFVRVDNILVIFHTMYDAARWPVTIYPGWLRATLTFLVPVTFAVTVPSEALIGRLSDGFLAATLALAVAMLATSRAFWKAGLKRYSGASA